MGKLDKGFAIGAVLAAITVGGLLYVVYQNGFNPISRASTQSATVDAHHAPSTTGGTSSNTVSTSPSQNFSNSSQNIQVPSGTSSASLSNNGY